MGLIILDQITKAIFAARDFSFGPLKVSLTKNYGLPFGISSESLISSVVVIICLISLIYFYWRNRTQLSRYQISCFVLIFAGAFSNLADRVLLGYVRDIFDLGLGFVFNFADLFIVLGLLLLVLQKREDRLSPQN